MAVAFRAGGNTTARSTTSQTVTVTSTNLGDCCVIVVANSNTAATSWASATASGLGATWSAPYLIPNVTGSTNTNAAVFIGWGCSAGQTSVSLTNLPATSSAFTSWGLWSGVVPNANPLKSTWGTVGPGAAATQVTTASASYNVGDLVLGLAYSFQWATANPSFSTGAVQNFSAQTGAGFQRFPWGSYVIESTGSSTTYTTATPAASQTATAGIMVLTPATVVTLTGSGSGSVSGSGTLTVSAGFPLTGTGSASVSGSATLGVIPNFNLYGIGWVGQLTDLGQFTNSFTIPTSAPTSLTVTTVNSGLNIPTGAIIKLDDGATNTVTGKVTSYSVKTLVIAVTSFTGSGTVITADIFVDYGIAATGTVSAFLPLTGSGSASASGSATVTVTPPTAIVGTGSTSASGAGTLSAFYPLTGSGSASVSGSGSLVVVPVVPITGSGSASVSGSGTLTPTFDLTGSGSASASGSGTVVLTFILVGQATATVTASASISAFLPLSGSGNATATGSGYLNIYPHTGPGEVATWWVTGKVRTRTSQGNVEGEELSPALVGKWETGKLETIVMAPLVQGGAEILKEN